MRRFIALMIVVLLIGNIIFFIKLNNYKSFAEDINIRYEKLDENLKHKSNLYEEELREKEEHLKRILNEKEDIEVSYNQLKAEMVSLKEEMDRLNNILKERQEHNKIAYLTFDDGPSKNTIKILDILKKYDVKATFFVNGNPKSKDIYKRIVDEGHTIANHTYTHNYKYIYSSVDNFMKDFERLNDFLEETVGIRPKILRLPGGSNNTVSHRYGGKDIMDKIIDELDKKNYIYFDWNVDSYDATALTQDKEVIINSVLKGAKNKKHAMILFHDSALKTTTAESLEEIILGLANQGFTFKAIDEYTPVQHFK